jgi:hypothetical protein
MLRILTVMMTGTLLLGAGCADTTDDETGEAAAPEIAEQRFGEASAAAFGCKGTRVALQTRNGKNYLTALAGGAFGIYASAEKSGNNETFKVYQGGFGRVALQAANGRYVARNPQSNGGGPRGPQGGGQQGGGVDLSSFLLSANNFFIDANALFNVQQPKDSKWTYVQTSDGFYVSALQGGGSLVDVALPIRTENAQLKAICVDDSDSPTDDEDDADEGNWDPGLGE